MNLPWVNLIVACSNFVGLYFASNNFGKHLPYILPPALASFLYHLAERKHELTGFPYIKNYDKDLIWLDRFFAFLSIFHVAKLAKWNDFPLRIGTIGILSLAISERDILSMFLKLILPINQYRVTKFDFMITHTTWHVCAFYVLWYVVDRK